MATQNVRILPYINQSVRITAKFWEDRGDHHHRGVDLSRGGNPPLYSMFNGTIIKLERDDSSSTHRYFGNYVIIKDNETGIASLYAHMDSLTVVEGQSVLQGQQVGTEGNTGASQGNHLHLEMQDLSNRNWRYTDTRSDYIDPADFIGYNEIVGDYLYYDGTPLPPTPTRNTKKRDFPWVIYRKVIRTKRT